MRLCLLHCCAVAVGGTVQLELLLWNAPLDLAAFAAGRPQPPPPLGYPCDHLAQWLLLWSAASTASVGTMRETALDLAMIFARTRAHGR